MKVVVVTIYHDPKECLNHIITSDVSLGGEHVVVSSEISSSVNVELASLVYFYKNKLGADKVRAYTIKQVLAWED